MIGMTAVLLFAVGVAAAQTQPLLAGTWVLDRAQSRFPAHEGKGHRSPDPQAQPADVKLVVEQQGNVLKATRTSAKGNREHSTAVTYVTDGTQQTQPGRRGTTVTRAAFEGDRLVVTTTHTIQGEQGDRTMTRESVWTLSTDGNVLTIDTKLQTPRGERNIKSVYLRG
jgi:hypothetical protein